ncbi:hypothetical protein POM88_036059 [Heracleum sosnowskyi]|uniref:C2H2-type domain-containing protein n=1 Tax=Heracleum sosnowskyi TaxID=360622 RepID=A0AAD8HMF5_9APIA|nr:hypothetical protein POM88_036059 [Heracleum sosnowskyi]
MFPFLKGSNRQDQPNLAGVIRLAIIINLKTALKAMSVRQGGGRKGVDRYRRGGRGNFGNRGRGQWTPRQNSQQISSSGSGNVAPETTKSVEEVVDASAINIDQAGQVEIPYQSSVQPNVTSSPQRHMQVARCELCRVDYNSFEILEQHKGGKKH